MTALEAFIAITVTTLTVVGVVALLIGGKKVGRWIVVLGGMAFALILAGIVIGNYGTVACGLVTLAVVNVVTRHAPPSTGA